MKHSVENVTAILVDDDEFQRKILNHQLTEKGIGSIVACTNGLEAIDQLNIRRIYDALILLDLNMPIMDGVAFLNLLQKTEFTGAIILISGEDLRILESTVKLAASYGFTVLGHLQKPVVRERLDYLVNKFLSHTNEKKKPGIKKEYAAERLRLAIKDGEIFNEYQPKVDMQTGQIIGAEALVRWLHPEDGVINPVDFIPLAEENALIDDLFVFVLRTALQDQIGWEKDGYELSVSVNVSVENLSSIEFVNLVKNELLNAGVEPQKLVLEITESTLVKEYSLVLGILTSLRLHKIAISIDDFGTGHSSMAQLRDIPFNELKLDRSFVHDACKDKTLGSIFNASLQLANNLNIKAVAEGIENIADWNFSAVSHCDIAQGSFISSPIPANQMIDCISEWSRKHASLEDDG
tara:strand:+ start:7902 stop:9125 length:1224 start_codon:yes stop_codon:yes gene_type:complete